MATINLPDELMAELQEKALADGKTIELLAEESLRKGLEESSWHDLFAYGRETGRASGYTEADLPEIIKARRRIIAQGR